MVFEIRRKLFHLLALAYVAGVYLLPRRTFIVVILFLLAAEAVAEALRLRVPAVGEFFSGFLGGLFRKEEGARISGAFWMLAGVLITCVIVGPPQEAATILLYLIFGDAAASLVGKGVGGPKWINSKKRVAGSTACFVVCLIVGTLMLRPSYSWWGIFLGALTAAVLEVGFIPLNDNLIIPAGCSLVFLLVYGWHPAFL